MKKVKLAVYDFDGTLYPGDTLRKFWAWSLRHKVKPWVLLPHALSYCLLYTLGLISKDTLKAAILKSFSKKNLKQDIKAFWGTTRPFCWVRSQFAKDRKAGRMIVCISASPDFFLKPLGKCLEWDHLIATPTKKSDPFDLAGPSARGPQKVIYLDKWAKKNKYNYTIETMFSDAIVDKPLLDLAEQAYTVPCSGKFYKGYPKK